MDTAKFEDALRRDGFNEISTVAFKAGHDLPDHAHPYALRALVLEGAFHITVDGKETTYRPGEVFALESGVHHTERSPAGVRFLIGRKR
jgi:quercetin dioxygenase-like cupin family protein